MREARLGRAAHCCILASVPLLGVAVAQAQARSGDERTRAIWDDAFRKQRAQAASDTSSAKPQAKPAQPGRTGQAAADDEGLGDSLVGVTLWKLRPLTPADERQGALLLAAGGEELTAERVEVGSPLAAMDRVRIGIEAARSGYLYLIDREQYADGSSGDPYLIFPRTRIRGGNNKVVAGRLVEVPDLADTPPYFTLKGSRPDHVGDVITVLLTPEPLPDLAPGRSALKLSKDQVSGWEKAWTAPSKRIELRGGAGTLYTAAERQASGTAARLLTQEEPVPQTMYRIEAKPGEPLLLAVPLAIQEKRR